MSATFQGCSGTNATYNLSVSDTYSAGEGWAVFSGTTNTVNGYHPASSSFSVAAGRTYTVRGVSDGSGRGGSAAVTISPVCNTCTPSPENCADGIGNDCDGQIDCADRDCGLSPDCNGGCTPNARSERKGCGDGFDNDCDGLTDCLDRDCRRSRLCP